MLSLQERIDQATAKVVADHSEELRYISILQSDADFKEHFKESPIVRASAYPEGYDGIPLYRQIVGWCIFSLPIHPNNYKDLPVLMKGSRHALQGRWGKPSYYERIYERWIRRLKLTTVDPQVIDKHQSIFRRWLSDKQWLANPTWRSIETGLGAARYLAYIDGTRYVVTCREDRQILHHLYKIFKHTKLLDKKTAKLINQPRSAMTDTSA